MPDFFIPSGESPINWAKDIEIERLEIEITEYSEIRHYLDSRTGYHKSGLSLQLKQGDFFICPSFSLHYRKNLVFVPQECKANGLRILFRESIKVNVSIYRRSINA